MYQAIFLFFRLFGYYYFYFFFGVFDPEVRSPQSTPSTQHPAPRPRVFGTPHFTSRTYPSLLRRPFWVIFCLTVDATSCHVLAFSLVRHMTSHRPFK